MAPIICRVFTAQAKNSIQILVIERKFCLDFFGFNKYSALGNRIFRAAYFNSAFAFLTVNRRKTQRGAVFGDFFFNADRFCDRGNNKGIG